MEPNLDRQRPASAPSAPRTSRISQVVTLVAVVVPPLGLALGDGPALGRRLPLGRPRALRRLYVVCAFGTTIGFHRYFTHTGFEAQPPVKATLAILGCMTMQGPLTQWVTDHRKHHALSDQPGDPHSPHAGHGDGALGARPRLRPRARRLAVHEPRAWSRAATTARTSTRTGSIRRIDRLYLLWVVLTLGIPFAIGYCVGGTWQAGVEGLVWGGLVRIFALPARDLQRELDLPHVRPPGLPLARRGAQQLARRAARLRRGLAQQPPRLPRLGAARARTAARSTSRGG